MSIEPYNRAERILSGEDLEPTTRLEYFMKEAASGGGGGGEKEIFRLVADAQTQELYLDDGKTFSDIDSAYQAGKDIVIMDEGRPASCYNFEPDEFGRLIAVEVYVFYTVFDDQDPSIMTGVDVVCVQILSDNVITQYGMTVSGTPF